MLSFKNLDIGYDKIILEKISGQIEEGSVQFLIGPNGSGKTSLLKTLAHIINPKDGVMSYEDRPVYLTSNPLIQDGLTGYDLLDLYGNKNSKWVDNDFLEFFDVKSLMNARLETLSMGERQRILITAVLSHNSNLVLMDEPLNHLDWNFALKLKKIIHNFSQRGRSFLISNHDLNWALNFTNTQTWVLFQKTIFLKNSTESVLNDIKLQEVFRIKTEILSSGNKKVISISEL